MDNREYLPGEQLGSWLPNPNFTGNKFKLFKQYPCKVLLPLDGIKKYMKLNMQVERLPSGQLYLSEVGGGVCFTDAIEDKHFKLTENQNG